jgi:hypothetical protein
VSEQPKVLNVLGVMNDSDINGKYVRAEDYDKIKAERDALLAALQDIAKYTSETHPNSLAEVLDENANIARAAIDAARGDK